MSVSKIFNYTRSFSSIPRTIASYFNSQRSNGDNNIAKNPNYAQRCRYSTNETEGLLPSLKTLSKRVRFYDRSEPEEEMSSR